MQATLDNQLLAAFNSPLKDRPHAYKSILQNILSQQPSQVAIHTFFTHIVQESLGLVLCRSLVQDFVTLFDAWGGSNDQEFAKAVWEHALTCVSARSAAFEAEISQICEHLATIHEEQEQWEEAARILQGIPLDSGHRTITAEYKCKIYIRIVQLFLEHEDSASADAYLNRMALVKDDSDPVLALKYQAAQARTLDLKRNFLASSSKYLDISYRPEIAEEERTQCLIHAITTAILAKAGAQRSRLLSILYKDERTLQVEFSIYRPILEKMFLGRLCDHKLKLDFQQVLRPHQLALINRTETVLDRAIMEHNILACSQVYNNITFEELGNLLSITPDRAESVACQMISEKRLMGSLDQIDCLVSFDTQRTLPGWETEVSRICHQVDNVVEHITKRLHLLT